MNPESVKYWKKVNSFLLEEHVENNSVPILRELYFREEKEKCEIKNIVTNRNKTVASPVWPV